MLTYHFDSALSRDQALAQLADRVARRTWWTRLSPPKPILGSVDGGVIRGEAFRSVGVEIRVDGNPAGVALVLRPFAFVLPYAIVCALLVVALISGGRDAVFFVTLGVGLVVLTFALTTTYGSLRAWWLVGERVGAVRPLRWYLLAPIILVFLAATIGGIALAVGAAMAIGSVVG